MYLNLRFWIREPSPSPERKTTKEYPVLTAISWRNCATAAGLFSQAAANAGLTLTSGGMLSWARTTQERSTRTTAANIVFIAGNYTACFTRSGLPCELSPRSASLHLGLRVWRPRCGLVRDVAHVDKKRTRIKNNAILSCSCERLGHFMFRF